MTATNKAISSKKEFSFSIVIPTWNNLPYLKFCIDSLHKNSHFTNQIIVYVNEGKDGTTDWLKSQENIDILHNSENKGVCYAVNACRTLVQHDYIVYMNDDMYACPNWDLELQQEIKTLNTDYFYLSSTLIEPLKLNNPNYVAIVKDYGDSIESFNEKALLEEYKNLHKANWQGSSWPPSVVHKKVWDLVGGFSIEFTPGMYSDPDFSMKLWQLGVRIFIGVGTSKVYHFGAKSTKRVHKNKGSDTFLKKWGMTSNTFYSQVLCLGKDYSGPYPETIEISSLSKIRNRLKRIIRSV